MYCQLSCKTPSACAVGLMKLLKVHIIRCLSMTCTQFYTLYTFATITKCLTAMTMLSLSCVCLLLRRAVSVVVRIFLTNLCLRCSARLDNAKLESFETNTVDFSIVIKCDRFYPGTSLRLHQGPRTIHCDEVIGQNQFLQLA